MRELLRIVLQREGFEVMVAENGTSRRGADRARAVDLLISDIRMPDMSGVEVLRAAQAIDPDIVGIMMTAFALDRDGRRGLRMRRAATSREAVRRGRAEDRGAQALRAPAARGRRTSCSSGARPRTSLPASSAAASAMLDVFQLVETVAPTEQHGPHHRRVGHRQGARRPGRSTSSRSAASRPFVAVNCGALPETLLESELFGHMRGAFTGADANKKGLIEVAEKGTIFLDEIGEMSPTMQVKLLRVLQERRFRRVGGTEEIEADIRVIAATNRDLTQAGGRRQVPRGSLLPAQRDPDAAAAAAGAPRGHSAARRAFRREVRRADGQADRRLLGGRPRVLCSATPGRATSASSRT